MSDLSELSNLMSLEAYEEYLREEGIIDEDGCPPTEPKTDAWVAGVIWHLTTVARVKTCTDPVQRFIYCDR